MSSDISAPERKVTPVPLPVLPITASSLPQKRPHDEDHIPSISSPLNPNPDVKPSKVQLHDDLPVGGREKPARVKRETVKKRESKGGAAAAAQSAPASSSRQTPEPDPKDVPPDEIIPARYKLPPPKLSDFEPAREPVFIPHHDVPALDGSSIEFFETAEHVYNKKNFHYLHCIADPAFPSSHYYRQTEPPPYGAHVSFEDAATHMYMDKSGRHITTDKGFRMARANVAVREGRWYWECRVTRGTVKSDEGDGKIESHGHVRMGFARREASLDAPVGFDAYSYGIRDVEGQKVHMSRPKDFFPPGEEIKEGDVIGMEIQLPSERLHRKIVLGQYNPAVDLADDESPTAAAANIVRDRIPIRFKSHIYFEKVDYSTTKELEDLMNPSGAAATGPGSGSGPGAAEKPNPIHQLPSLRTLPNSHIKVYKNGKLVGTPFTDLLAFLPPASRPQAQVGAREGTDDGMLGYYPAISVFRGGAAELNFGPDFWFPPPSSSANSNNQPSTTDGTTEQGNGDVDMGGMIGNGDGDAAAEEAAKDQLLQPAAPPVLRPLAQRYDEQIVEDVVADIVDEVTFWMQDGAQELDRTMMVVSGGGREEDEKEAETGGGGGGSGVGEEIKELVQDD